jgi:hypothetical protein
MKKLLTSAIILILCAVTLPAQKPKDVLYLKNGSMIFGKLLEISENQYKIRTDDGSIFIFKVEEVEKFLNEPLKFDGRKKNGFGFALEAGFLAGGQNTEYIAPFSFNYLGSYTSGTRNVFGLGSGVEFIGQSFMPLFLEYKYIMSEKKTSPFIFLRSGGLFHISGDGETSNYYSQYSYLKSYKGGFSFTLGTGISWAKDDYETYLSFAYRNAHTSYTEKNYNSQLSTYHNTLNRLEVKFGFRF